MLLRVTIQEPFLRFSLVGVNAILKALILMLVESTHAIMEWVNLFGNEKTIQDDHGEL